MLTVPETAERLGRHPETVRRWIRSGRLRASKVVTQHVIDEEDLAALTTDQRLRRGADRLGLVRTPSEILATAAQGSGGEAPAAD
jgi:excisionase family DNA binding protein